MGCILRTQLEFKRAGTRTGEAQVNVFEPGLLTVAAVVNHQVPALEADFRQVAAVEAECAEAVHPGEESRKTLLRAASDLGHIGPLPTVAGKRGRGNRPTFPSLRARGGGLRGTRSCHSSGQ